MELVGKIIKLLPLATGESSKGPWKKQEYILETEAQYPKQVCFNAWGDKVDQFNIQEGQSYRVSIDIESREYNEKWYTDVKAWKVEPLAGGTTVAPLSSQNGSIPSAPPVVNSDEDPFSGSSDEDVLPF